MFQQLDNRITFPKSNHTRDTVNTTDVNTTDGIQPHLLYNIDRFRKGTKSMEFSSSCLASGLSAVIQHMVLNGGKKDIVSQLCTSRKVGAESDGLLEWESVGKWWAVHNAVLHKWWLLHCQVEYQYASSWRPEVCTIGIISAFWWFSSPWLQVYLQSVFLDMIDCVCNWSRQWFQSQLSRLDVIIRCVVSTESC